MVMPMFVLKLVFLSNYFVAACMMLMYSFTLFCSNANWIKVHVWSRIETRLVICGLVTLGLQSDSVSMMETYLLLFSVLCSINREFCLDSSLKIRACCFCLCCSPQTTFIARTNYNVSLLCVFFFVHASVLLFQFFILIILPFSYVSYVHIPRSLVFP